MAKKKQIPVDELKDGPGVTHLNPHDAAYPFYKVLDAMRHPLTLRDMMIQVVRTGYISDKSRKVDASVIPLSGATLFPQVKVSELLVPSPDGPIRCLVYHPPTTKKKPAMMLYAHGGGFMVGRSEDTDFMTRKLAFLNELIVVSVNYRLAPEFPFPFGLTDYYRVYHWLQDYGSELGGNPKQIVVSGDSAGSNLAAVVPLIALDQGDPLPSAVLLFGPVVDMHFEDYHSFNELAPLGIVYDTAFMGFLRGAYLPNPKLWDEPYASPLLGNLSHYPPTMLLVGTEDPMIDSATVFADKLQQMSLNESWLYVCEGMPHGFYFFPNIFEEEEQAYQDIRQFLSRHLETPKKKKALRKQA